MKILHITDLHFSNTMGKLTRQNKLIADFLKDIEDNVSSVDLIIFSGDLVNSGNSEAIFDKANSEFISPILDRLKMGKDKFFICPGNHDVDRGQVSQSVVKFLDEEITDNLGLNNFFKRKDSPDLRLTFNPLSKYNSFVEKFYASTNLKDVFTEMYSAHIRKIGEKKVGIISINSAWRSIGINDDNNLLFPLDQINYAIDEVINCDLKILIHHHPLSDFKSYNKFELEDIIHKRFDFIFSGHIHKNALSIEFTFNEGAVKIGSSACLNYDKDTDVGYSVIEINIDELKGCFKSRLYNTTYESFYWLEDKEFLIPSSTEKIQQNNLRKNIRQRLFDELENSKNLFVEIESGDTEKTILELSTEPVLKERSQSEVVKSEQADVDFQWANFHRFEDDYVIFGKDKCGKTILLKKIEIELLSNYSLHNFIPFYIDIKEWKNLNKNFEFKKEFSKYYFINQTEAENLLNEKQIVFLIDNYHVDYPQLKSYIESFISIHPNVRLIICAVDSTLNSLDKNNIDGRVLKKLYFHRLRKMHIKLLAKKNTNLSEEKQDQIAEKIDNIFKRLSIPFNYWTVSVFLWIFKKDLNANFQNDVDLINLYIERLIEKEQLTLTKSSFTFANYKKLLAYLAHFLLTNYHKDSYYAKFSEIIIFIDNYLKKNPRFKVNSKDIFEYLDLKGIFKKKNDDMYSFRLNGVFEYFIAYYMTIDKDFLNGVIDDKNFYLSFSNEFELYAGFKREDENFLKKIYEKTKISFSPLNEIYETEKSFDSLLTSKVLEAREFTEVLEKFTRRLKDGLTETEQDQIEEELIKELGFDDSNSDVKTKQINLLNDSSESLEASMQILGRVYKNIDDIDDVELVYEIFDYIIANTILWGFKLIDEFKDISLHGFTKTDSSLDAKFLSKVLTNYIPTLVQVRLNDMLGHSNLEKIINERLEELQKDFKNHQYKIFVLSFLLLDINLDQNKYLLEKIIPLIRMPLIKYSFILKMNYYLAFKTSRNPELKKFLQKNIQHQYLKFNNQIDLGDLHRNFSDKQNKEGAIRDKR